MSNDVQIDNLESILKDPLNADFSNFEGLEKVNAGAAKESGGLDSDDLGAGDAAAQPTAGAKDEKPTDESSAVGATEAAESTTDEATPETDESGHPKGAAIQTRDGKHTIPYSVLQAARDRERALSRQLAELNTKLANTQAAAETGQADKTPDVDDIMSPEDLEALKADAPNLGNTFERLIKEIKSLKATATQVQAREEDDVARRVQDAIDAHPKLSYLQASDPDKFSAIAAIDEWAKDQPQFRSMTLPERFAKSLAMYEAAHGVVQLPASASGTTTTTTDAQAKADEAIAKALASAGPNTLTDIPGGNPPPKNDLEAAESMSSAMLTEQFMHMDPASLNKYLAKFG